MTIGVVDEATGEVIVAVVIEVAVIEVAVPIEVVVAGRVAVI